MREKKLNNQYDTLSTLPTYSFLPRKMKLILIFFFFLLYSISSLTQKNIPRYYAPGKNSDHCNNRFTLCILFTYLISFLVFRLLLFDIFMKMKERGSCTYRVRNGRQSLHPSSFVSCYTRSLEQQLRIVIKRNCFRSIVYRKLRIFLELI